VWYLANKMAVSRFYFIIHTYIKIYAIVVIYVYFEGTILASIIWINIIFLNNNTFINIICLLQFYNISNNVIILKHGWS